MPYRLNANFRRTLLAIIAASAAMALGASSGRAASRRLGIFKGETDVGVTKPGSAAYDPSTHSYRITGGGANMWAGTDAFYYVWRRWKGDVSITADISIVTATGSPHRKAALMIRQGLGPSDAYADAALHGAGLTALQYRQKEGATTLEAISPISSPKSLRLVRQGNEFMLYVAGSDGVFKKVGSARVELRDPVYIGLAVCAHDADALTTAIFNNVKISRTPPGIN